MQSFIIRIIRHSIFLVAIATICSLISVILIMFMGSLHIQSSPTDYAAPIIVSIVMFLVFYLAAFVGVIIFDKILFIESFFLPGHWIRDWVKKNAGDVLGESSSGESDQTDSGDVEKGLTTRTHYMYSTDFKRRPSLKKVVQ